MTALARRAFLLMALVALVAAGPLAATLPAEAAPSRPPADAALVRVVARFATPAARDAVLRAHAAVLRGTVGRTGFVVLEVPGTSAAAVAAAIAGEPGVLAAQPDARASLHFTPNDPYFTADPYSGVGEWGLRMARFDLAWDLQRGSSAIVVATVDTGADPTHPDLAGVLVDAPRIVSAPDPSCPSGLTNIDDNGHGTHVAGIIGADGNNGVGITGAAFGVRVMPIKALDCLGSGYLSDIATGIEYAIDHGARVINISLGSPEQSLALESAVDDAISHNVLVVAAAGNCGAESGTSRCPIRNAPDYPAAYPGVLAVGATTMGDTLASFSTSAGYVGITAPGTQILSTFPTYPVRLNQEIPTSSYAVLSGTSQASPLVAAGAALLLSHDPTLSAKGVAAALEAAADGAVRRLDVEGALRGQSVTQYGARYWPAIFPNAVATGSAATGRIQIENTSNFTWRASGPHPVRVATHWYGANGQLVLWDGSRTDLGGDLAPGDTTVVDVPLAPDVPKGSYLVRVDVVEEGVEWFSQETVPPLALRLLVNAGFDATYQTAAGALSAATGSGSVVQVVLTNTGPRPWNARPPYPVYLASHVLDAAGHVVIWDGPRAPFLSDVAPGASVTVALPLALPAAPGTYTVQLDLVEEGLTWFSHEFVPVRPLTITVPGRAVP